MAARLQYSNDALVGNWYEDRLDRSSAPIPELERTGKYRTTPLKMFEGPHDEQDYISTSHAFHRADRNLPTPPKPQMICRSTLALANEQRLPPKGSRPHGFGSVRPRHEPDHDRRRMETSTHSAYGGKYADTPEKRRDPVEMGHHALQAASPAGLVLPLQQEDRRQGIRTAMGGASTDERLQVTQDTDPKCHSFVQRTWLGHDSHAQYVLQADQFAKQRADMAARATTYAVPGLGPSTSAGPSRAEAAAAGQKFYKRNDTLRRDTGIWSEF
jgi:hypothetical protein